MTASELPLYGALDLGTNNCRLLLAKPSDEGFHVVEAFSRVTRLGEGLAGSGSLSEEAIAPHFERAPANAPCGCKDGRYRACGRWPPRLADAPSMARLFWGASRKRPVWSWKPFPPTDEARLALAGCSPLLDRTRPFALVFDIGGGSTELIKVRLGASPDGDRVETLASLPVGVVTLAEAADAKLCTPEGYERIVGDLVETAAALQPAKRSWRADRGRKRANVGHVGDGDHTGRCASQSGPL